MSRRVIVVVGPGILPSMLRYRDFLEETLHAEVAIHELSDEGVESEVDTVPMHRIRSHKIVRVETHIYNRYPSKQDHFQEKQRKQQEKYRRMQRR